MNIIIKEQKGEQSLKGLLELTKQKEKEQYKKAHEEILKGVFE